MGRVWKILILAMLGFKMRINVNNQVGVGNG